MHRPDMLLAVRPRLDPLEHTGRFEGGQDSPDAHGRLDIAAVTHVMDVVTVVDDQGDLPRCGRGWGLGCGGLGDVLEGAQYGGIVAKGRHHP